jgi:TRAP-type C4-dicarboxylate transport system substrate-binding protein
MRLTCRIAAFVLLMALVGGCSSGADRAGGDSPAHPRTLRFVTQSAVPTEVAAWAQEVQKESHGTLRIRFSPEWRASDSHGEVDTLTDVRRGTVDLAWVGARVFDRVGVTSFQPLLAPFLVDSYPLERRVFEDPLVGRMVSQMSGAGVAGLAMLPGPMRHILGVTHAFRRPSDFAGSVVGMQDSLESADALRLLGAVPRPVPAEATLRGLDGYEQQLAAIAGNGHLHSARYLTANVDLWPRPLVVVANERMLKSLTPLQRKALQSAGRAVLPRAMLAASREDTAAMAIVCGLPLHVVTASPADLRALRAAVQPVYNMLASRPSARDVIRQILRLKDQVGASPASVPGCGAATVRSGTSASVDGTYAVSIDPTDLPAAARLPELYGRWQVVIDHGRFRFSQASGGADWIGDGSVALVGDTMTWTFAHAGDIGPNGTPDGTPVAAGQTVRFHWQRRGDQLRLTSLDSPPPILALAVKALARSGDAPGQQPLVNPAPLQGIWKTNVTAADVVAHHGDPNGIADNTGPLRLTIQGSRFRFTQRAPDGFHDQPGTIRYAGDTIELDASGSDSTPVFFVWSVYKNQLTLRPDPIGTLSGWDWHSWQRVG